MTTTSLLTPQTRATRASVGIWFIIIGMPMLMLGLMLGVDVTRIVIDNSRAVNAAAAAAQAGALQIDYTVGGLREGNQYVDGSAEQAAHEFYRFTTDVEQAAPSGRIRTRLIRNPRTSLHETIEVELWYDQRGLIIADGLVNLMSGSGLDVEEFYVRQRASVCRSDLLPGETGPTGGTCARPLR